MKHKIGVPISKFQINQIFMITNHRIKLFDLLNTFYEHDSCFELNWIFYMINMSYIVKVLQLKINMQL